MVLTRSGRNSLGISNASSTAPDASTRKRSRGTAASPPAATPRRSRSAAKKVQSQHRDEIDMNDAEDEQREQKNGLRRSARLRRRGEVETREDGGDDVAPEQQEVADSEDGHRRKKRRLQASSEAGEENEVEAGQAVSDNCSSTCDSSELEDEEDDDIHENDDERVDPQADCYLLHLPLELVLMLFEAIEASKNWKRTDTLRTLAQTCKLFRRQMWNELLIDRFENVNSKRIFILDTAKEGDFGWKPFIVAHAFENDESTDDKRDVLLACRSFDPEEYYDRRNVNEYLYLRSRWYQPYIDKSYWDGGAFAKDDKEFNFEVYSWKKDVQPGRLLPATVHLLRQRFVCPECNNKSTVMYGSRDLAQRWPDMFSVSRNLQHWCDCPRCVVSAFEAAMHHEDFVLFRTG